MGVILPFYVVIGVFTNALPALVLTVPVFFPIAMKAGFAARRAIAQALTQYGGRDKKQTANLAKQFSSA
jgi:predicted benzoate:H+ symporter BenE